ncbi:hypothetical protein FRB99_001016 [Tulasnella sp. 403]|nr:hypothetical protein FRB99_001016 [Tulasnella sp. 403]
MERSVGIFLISPYLSGGNIIDYAEKGTPTYEKRMKLIAVNVLRLAGCGHRSRSILPSFKVATCTAW